MPQIKCYKNCCSNNYCTHCTREGIDVDDEALCTSFRERNESNAEKARYEYEFAQDMGASSEIDNHSIMCKKESCYYQKAGVCKAKKINVDDNGKDALCISFTLK